jgi:hypothetical protein
VNPHQAALDRASARVAAAALRLDAAAPALEVANRRNREKAYRRCLAASEVYLKAKAAEQVIGRLWQLFYMWLWE